MLHVQGPNAAVEQVKPPAQAPGVLPPSPPAQAPIQPPNQAPTPQASAPSPPPCQGLCTCAPEPFQGSHLLAAEPESSIVYARFEMAKLTQCLRGSVKFASA